MTIKKLTLSQPLDCIDDFWSPRVIGELNGQHVRLAKIKGEFVWHHHENEDELFLVLKGELTIRLRDQDDITLGEGEMVIIPRGVEHQPVTAEEVHILLFEPAQTINTGNVINERTISTPDPI